MKRAILLLTVLTVIPPAVWAVDLDKLASEPARIVAEQMKPVPLRLSDIKKGWIEIPEVLQRHLATIYRPDRDQLGIADFRVLEDGYVLLACNFDYQGNSSGGWRDEVLTRQEFQRLGWKEIRKPKKLGGSLVQSDGRIQTIFFKKVHKGETCRLRCNKYDPPYPILLRPLTESEGAGTSQTSSASNRLRSEVDG